MSDLGEDAKFWEYRLVEGQGAWASAYMVFGLGQSEDLVLQNKTQQTISPTHISHQSQRSGKEEGHYSELTGKGQITEGSQLENNSVEHIYGWLSLGLNQ